MDITKSYCYENPKIEEIPNLREMTIKDFHKAFPINFRVRTIGEHEVSYNDIGENKTLRTYLWSMNFEKPWIGDENIYSLEFEEGIRLIKCNKATFEFYDVSVYKYDPEWKFVGFDHKKDNLND